MSAKRILVVNTGSSSLKFKLYDLPLHSSVSGLIERIGDPSNSTVTIKVLSRTKMPEIHYVKTGNKLCCRSLYIVTTHWLASLEALLIHAFVQGLPSGAERIQTPLHSFSQGLKYALSVLRERISSKISEEVKAVGHRIVHGTCSFSGVAKLESHSRSFL